MLENHTVSALKFVLEKCADLKKIISTPALVGSDPTTSATTYNNLVFQSCLNFEMSWRVILRTCIAAKLTKGTISSLRSMK